MKFRSWWPTFILRSCVGSYWFIIPNNDVHTWNSLQGIRHKHWTMKYRSQWPIFIFRSKFGSYWFTLRKYDVHTSSSLQDIRQNHWTVKYRSCWPSIHDPQVHVTRLSHVWPTICVSCFHNRKVENTFKRCPSFWPLAPPWGMDPGVTSNGIKADPPGYLWSKYECFLMSGCWDIPHLKNFNVKLWSNSRTGRNHKRTNIRTDEWKDENYILLGINAGGIKMTKVCQKWFSISYLFAKPLFSLQYHNVLKFSHRQVWANSADPDQTAQGLHCLLFCLHLLGKCICSKMILF